MIKERSSYLLSGFFLRKNAGIGMRGGSQYKKCVPCLNLKIGILQLVEIQDKAQSWRSSSNWLHQPKYPHFYSLNVYQLRNYIKNNRQIKDTATELQHFAQVGHYQAICSRTAKMVDFLLNCQKQKSVPQYSSFKYYNRCGMQVSKIMGKRQLRIFLVVWQGLD